MSKMSFTFIKLNKKYHNFIYKLRNDKQVRKQSIKNTKFITEEEHFNWLKKINQNNIHIIKYKNMAIGYLRLDQINEFIFEISFALIEDMRNKGLSFEILNLFHRNLKKNIILIAYIKNKNLVSKKIFERCNYFEIFSNKEYSSYYNLVNNNSKTNFNLKLIDEIQKVRSKNNLNWMDILRVAMQCDPIRTSKIFKKISYSDNQILSLTKKIK